jgi:hypothetical protein
VLPLTVLAVGPDRFMAMRTREKGITVHDPCYLDVCKQPYTVIQLFGEYDFLEAKTR